MTTYSPAPGSSSGQDRPCAAAPADAVIVRGYPALERPRQGQAATPSPSATLDPSTGPGPVTPAALAAPGGLRPFPPDDGKTGPDQRRRALSTRSSKPLGDSAHPRRSAGRCGWTTIFAKTADPSKGKAVWQKCEARGCPYCGPALRERDLAHDIANLSKSGRPVVRRVIDVWDEATWKRLRAKIKRAAAAEGVEGGWTAYPRHGRELVVYAVVGMTGALVGDLADELSSDYEGIPAGEQIRRPRCWALHRKVVGRGDGEKAWKLVGASTVTHRTPDVLRRLGLYRDQVDEAAVPAAAWEVHNFTLPPLESRAFRQLEQAFDLERDVPRPRKRPRGRAKAVGE